MQIKIPSAAEYILKTLMDKGYEAYVVGGCVRDSLIGKVPDDWDITTSAKPEAIKSIFNKTIDTGLLHGTVTVLVDHAPFEVTTYRIDGDYEDNRRPTSVEFTPYLIEDLKRRDFTINAMAYNHEHGLVDAFDGVKDLENGILRCVGNPSERFNEDALRMLRAIRFSAQLDFDIHEATEKAIKTNGHLIQQISAERIQIELVKLLTSNHPDKFKLLYSFGLLKWIIPEYIPCFETEQNNPHHQYDVAEHTLIAVKTIDNTPVLRLTMLFHDIGKPYKKTTDEKGIDHFYGHANKSKYLTEKILKRLKFDNKTIDQVLHLIDVHDYRFEPHLKSVRKAINRIGKDYFEAFLSVRKADIIAQSDYLQKNKLEVLEEIRQCYEEIMSKNQCVSIKQLEIGGRELLSLGIPQGKLIGEVLHRLLEMVLEEPMLNEKERLLDMATDYYKNKN